MMVQHESREKPRAGSRAAAPATVAARATLLGAIVPKSEAVTRLVKRELSVAPLSLSDPFPKKFNVYLDLPLQDSYAVPLHWARQQPQFSIRDERPEGVDVPGMAFAGALRPELRQPEAVEAVRRTWDDEGGGATLALSVGFGKTTCALWLACSLKKKTLVVVHKALLAEQWAERIASFVPGARVSHVRGGACDTSGDFVVAMLQTLVSRRYPPSTFRDFGLTIVDEVHHVGAAAFSRAMWGVSCRRVLGLTATPDRKDGLARVVCFFCGPIAFRVRRENQAGTEVRVVRYDCPAYAAAPPTNRRGDVCFVTMVTRMVEDPARTRVVARAVADLPEEHDVLVLTHRRQHVADLAAELRRLGVPAGTYVGGDKAAPPDRVVVSTYALTSEGFDLPRLTALVLATPMSDVEQSCGRVMRGGAGGGSVIVDVVDAWGAAFSQYAKRRAFYKRSGFSVAGDARDAGDPVDSFGPVDPVGPVGTCAFLEDDDD